MTEELCPALIRKNIVLAETGGELTLPLARLNESCQFKKRWDEIQDKWHPIKRCLRCRKEIIEGTYCSDECAGKNRKYQLEYQRNQKVKARLKAYNAEYQQRPEIIKRRRERYLKKKALNKSCQKN